MPAFLLFLFYKSSENNLDRTILCFLQGCRMSHMIRFKGESTRNVHLSTRGHFLPEKSVLDDHYPTL